MTVEHALFKLRFSKMEWDINVYQEYSSIKFHDNWRRQDRPEEDAEESSDFTVHPPSLGTLELWGPFRVPLEPGMKARGLSPKLWKWRQNDTTWRPPLPNNKLRVNQTTWVRPCWKEKKKKKRSSQNWGKRQTFCTVLTTSKYTRCGWQYGVPVSSELKHYFHEWASAQ